MDVDKFGDDDVWDDALFNIDDEPDSPAGVADFEVEKCELKPHNAPLLPDIVPSFADGFDEACEKAAASMPGDLFPQMVSPVASPALPGDLGLSGVALRVARAFGAEHGCGAAVKACAFAVASLPEDAQQAAVTLVEAASISPDGVGAFAQVLQREAAAAADADRDRRRAWRPLAAWRASRTLFAPSFDEAAATAFRLWSDLSGEPFQP